VAGPSTNGRDQTKPVENPSSNRSSSRMEAGALGDKELRCTPTFLVNILPFTARLWVDNGLVL